MNQPDTLITLLHSQHAMLMEALTQVKALIEELALWRETAANLQQRVKELESQ